MSALPLEWRIENVALVPLAILDVPESEGNSYFQRVCDVIAIGSGQEFTDAAGRRAVPCPSCFAKLNARITTAGDEWDREYAKWCKANALVARESFENRNVFPAACRSGCTPAELTTVIHAHALEQAKRSIDRAKADLARQASVMRAPAKMPEWDIPGLVPSRAVTLWIGETSNMKTWIMLHAAICIASGISWCGRPVKRRRVMLCLMESREINEARIEYLARGLGTTREGLEGWLFVYPATTLKTDDPKSTAMLALYLRELDIDVLMIDNLKKIRSSRTQSAANDESVMASVIEPLESLANTGTINGEDVGRRVASVILAHGEDRVRGSTGVPEHADWVLLIDRRGKKPDSPTDIDCGDGCRLMHADAGISIRYRGVMPDPIAPELVKDEVVPAQRAVTIDNTRARLVKIIEDDPGKTWTAIRSKLGGDPARLADVRDELEAERVIEKRDGRWFLVEVVE